MKQVFIAWLLTFSRLAFGDLSGIICSGEQCKQMQQNQDFRLFTPMQIAPITQTTRTSAMALEGKATSPRTKSSFRIKDKIKATQAHSAASAPEEAGNLPAYLTLGATPISSAGAEAGFFMTFSSKKGSLKSARAGSVFNAVIEQAILASPTTPNPIVATLTSGPLAGATLLGEAAFGKELKCILLNFNLLKSKDGESTFQLKGVGTAPSGEACIEGQYESQNGRFFLAEMLATGTAVVVDSQVQRSQNVLGNYIEEPSLSNAAKKGLAASLTKTAEHAAEGMKAAPEFTRLAGFQSIRVIFQTDPIEN